MDANAMLEVLKQGTDAVLLESQLLERLQTGRPLRIKAGFDPTAPDLHLGHCVLLQKLRQFQSLGHHIFFLVGDFTAMIGDPTGKNITRKPLEAFEVQANAKTYQEQAFKLLDSEKTEVIFNSSWLGALSPQELIKLAASYTVAQLLEREDFHQRYTQGTPIAVHEFLYPLLQGYDSVVLKSDVEIGGTDQRFNLLVGRELQKQRGQSPQVVMTMPLLEGTDGVKKMSKSLGNYIGITESPEMMFGKLMSISDTLMWRYFELLTDKTIADIERMKLAVEEGRNPRDIKFELGIEIVGRFHGGIEAEKAKAGFIDRFQQKQTPDMPLKEIVLPSEESDIWIAHLLVQAELLKTSSEALRLIDQGAVRIDGERVSDQKLRVARGFEGLIQVGKLRFARVHLT